jgi:catalase
MRVIAQVAESGDPVNDVTIQWPGERSQINLGTVTLTERVPVPDEDQAKQRIIFDPVPRVDGIDLTDDPLFEIRSAIYLLSGRRRRSESAAEHSKP